MIEMKLTGFKGISGILQTMPDKLMEKHIRKANYEACKIIRDAARAKAPMHAGPYPATRRKGMSTKMLAKTLAQLEKKGITAEEIISKSYGLSGRQKGNQDRKPGTLKKSIIIGAIKGRRDRNYVKLAVGLMKRAYYGKWIEMGFIHYGKKKQTHVPGRPFLRPAFDGNLDAVIIRFRERLLDGLSQESKHA
ncbi:MAG: hypothetical protein ABFD81_08990 [Syntrophaceae bacterium]